MFIQSIKSHFLGKVRLGNFLRWYLTAILMFLPFQQRIIRIELLGGGLIKFISIIDELTIVILFPLALIEIYKNRTSRDRVHLILLFPLLIMGIAGILSGIFNGNPFFISLLGSFDYIKNFLVIFIFAAFFRDFRDFKKIFRLLLATAVCLGVFALIQEVWAVISRYIFQKDIYDPGIYILRNTPRLIKEGWRFGIYRTASLMFNQNMFGLYSLLILTVYLCSEKKMNHLLFIPLFTGVVVSVSRTVYAGFAILAVLQIMRGRKWFIIFLVPAVFFLFSMSNNNISESGNVSNMAESNILIEGEDSSVSEIYDVMSYRAYSRDKAMEVWKDYPYFGVGPGMFGGPISVKYNSHFYEEYNFQAGGYREYLQQIKGFDQFWSPLLAEMGIIGTAAFAGIIITLFVMFYLLKQEEKSYDIKGLYTALMLYTAVIVIYTFGSGLNLVAVLFTYSAFAGIGLGCKNNQVIDSYNTGGREKHA